MAQQTPVTFPSPNTATKWPENVLVRQARLEVRANVIFSDKTYLVSEAVVQVGKRVLETDPADVDIGTVVRVYQLLDQVNDLLHEAKQLAHIAKKRKEDAASAK